MAPPLLRHCLSFSPFLCFYFILFYFFKGSDSMGCFMVPPLLCHRLLPFLLFCVFFFFLVQIHWEAGNRENRSDHGSQNRVVRPRFARVPVFSHRTVLKAKRTAKINGSRFFRSDRTVRSGFQNLANGFQIGWVSNRQCGFLIGGFVGLMVWWRGFFIGVGLMVCVCVCGWGKQILLRERLRERVVVEGGRLIQRGFDGLCLWFMLEVEGDWGKKILLESPGKWNHA